MRYIFLIYSQEVPDGLSPEELGGVQRAHGAVMEGTAQKGVLRGVEALKPTTTATTVRMKNGAAITTDGPFAETKEQLAGFYVIECQNLDEAIEWAKQIPTACKGGNGCIEIRPIHELARRP